MGKDLFYNKNRLLTDLAHAIERIPQVEKEIDLEECYLEDLTKHSRDRNYEDGLKKHIDDRKEYLQELKTIYRDRLDKLKIQAKTDGRVRLFFIFHPYFRKERAEILAG